MQADYLPNLPFPHPTPPSAANKVASLMRLPHLIVLPFSLNQQTRRLQLPVNICSASLAGMPRETPHATQWEIQDQEHPPPRNPPQNQ